MVEEDHLSSWQTLEEMARDFEAEHPGLSVRCLPLGGAAGSQDKGKFLLAGNVPLDLLRIDVTEFSAYLGEGALVDLEPYFAADPAWDERAFFSQVLDAIRGPQDARGEPGHLFGLPSTFTPYVMYVNLDRLAEIGFAGPRPDWTWDEFLALARTATVDDDGDGRPERFGISLTQWLQAVAPWVWQAGGELLDDAGHRSRMAEPAFAGALQFLHDLLHTEQVASFDASFPNQLSQGLFQAGRALFYGPVGYWETYRFRSLDEFAWDVLPLPRDVAAATSVAMTVYVVPRTAREPELACEFLRLLCSLRYQRLLAEIGNGVPGRIEAARSPSFLAPDRPPASERVFLDSMASARFLPPLANWRKIESLCRAELEGILLDPDVDVAAACAEMARKTDDYLARERERNARPRLPRGLLEISVSLSLLTLIGTFLARSARASGRVERRTRRAAWGLLAPWACGFVLFFLGPALVSLFFSFCEWSPLRPLGDARWVGLENFRRLADDPTFRTSLGATLSYAGLSVPLSTAAALALALLLRSGKSGVALFRTIVYVPAILSPVVVAALWRFVLDADQGLLNRSLGWIGLAGPAWLRDPDWVVPGFVLVSLWGLGSQVLVFVAALQTLDPSLDEAARIDGAGTVRRFWHVTLPGLGPVLLFNLITGAIQAFQVFAQPYGMTEGGPGDSSRFLVLYLFETAFHHLDMGYASAQAWVLFVLLALLCLSLLRAARRRVHYAGRTP